MPVLLKLFWFRRQNLELLIPEGTFTLFSLSVRACKKATLISTTRNPKSLQLAALANKYMMKNVSGVPANKSCLSRSALNCRTQSRDLNQSPRHSSTQTMSYAYFPGGDSSTNSNSSKFNMFRNSSSRPAFNSSSGNFPLSPVRSRLRSTDGVSQRSLLTAAMRPASKFSFPALGTSSDYHLLGVSAVKLDAPPGSTSGSPIFLFLKLTSASCTILRDFHMSRV